jgi:hypothetical protein
LSFIIVGLMFLMFNLNVMRCLIEFVNFMYMIIYYVSYPAHELTYS